MSDTDDVTCARFALGEFAVAPRSAPTDEGPPALLGGRYEVGRLIGSGGTARVFRAHDLRLGREVAVKIYDCDAVAVDQRRRLREMSIQGSIAHPRVVALLDSGVEHGRTFLVMQLVEGENLAERLLGGPLPAAEVTALAAGLAEGLAHVHALRVVHRDLKPANVFLSDDGPLIGDFGIAHALDTTHITGTGVVPGTAAYLAPEQVGGDRAGPPADIYALGLILLECLTGEREYQGTMVEAAMARLTRPPRIPDGLPPALAETLSRMTRREPADRPTAAEVLWLLYAPSSTLYPVVPDTRPARRRRVALTAVLAAAAAVTAATVLLTGPDAGPGTSPASPPGPGATAAAQPPASTPAPAGTAPATEDAALEPAAVTHRSDPRPQSQSGAEPQDQSQSRPQEQSQSQSQGQSQKVAKQGKPEKPEKPGNGKGKGPGSDS
jgi:serine/threonine protein kinase